MDTLIVIIIAVFAFVVIINALKLLFWMLVGVLSFIGLVEVKNNIEDHIKDADDYGF